MSGPHIARHHNAPDTPGPGGSPQGSARFTRPLAGPQPTGNGLAIAGMTLGIVSLPTCWTGLLALTLIILSIVFSSIGIRNANHGAPLKGMAIAGLVCGIIGALGYLIIGIASAGIGFIL